MSTILTNSPYYFGKALNFCVRGVLEVAGVAAIPYWAKQANVLSEDNAFYLASAASTIASIRFVASFHTKKLEKMVLDNPKSCSSKTAQFFYALVKGKKVKKEKTLPLYVLHIARPSLHSTKMTSAI